MTRVAAEMTREAAEEKKYVAEVTHIVAEVTHIAAEATHIVAQGFATNPRRKKSDLAAVSYRRKLILYGDQVTHIDDETTHIIAERKKYVAEVTQYGRDETYTSPNGICTRENKICTKFVERISRRKKSVLPRTISVRVFRHSYHTETARTARLISWSDTPVGTGLKLLGITGESCALGAGARGTR